jgi:cytosine/uracil/thiamine/allantoin permease
MTPWVIINLIAYVQRRGWYDVDDLQVFNAGQRGGIYWFTGGWNLRATLAFVPAVVVGLMFVNTTLFKGPWADAANGVDLSLASGAVVAGVLYLAFTALFPEPAFLRGDPEAASDLLAMPTDPLANVAVATDVEQG